MELWLLGIGDIWIDVFKRRWCVVLCVAQAHRVLAVEP